MKRDEWCAYAESVSLTPEQRGAILGHCDRLGLSDRSDRLAVLAELLELDELDSTADLTLGQAGRLVRVLRHISTPAGLPDVTAAAVDGDQADEHDVDSTEAGISLADALQRIAVIIYLAFTGTGAAA